MLELFSTTGSGPIVKAIVTQGRKLVKTSHRPPTEADLEPHLAGQVALGVIPDSALCLDLDHHRLEDLAPLVGLLKDLGLAPYFGPGTTRGSRVWIFTKPGNLEPIAKSLANLAKAMGFSPCESYPNGGKPIILPFFGALSQNGQRRPLFDPDGVEVSAEGFEPQRVSLETLSKVKLATDLFLAALARKPNTRHDAAMAFLNLANRLGVLDELATLMGTEALFTAWGLGDSRTLEAWKDEVQRLAEAAKSDEYAHKRGIPYLLEEGFELPDSVLGSIPASERYPEPLPLYRPPLVPEPFPLEDLGPLEAVVREVIRITKAPDALVAASFLASASFAAQGVADVEIDGRRLPLSLYFLTIAESGERKTAVDLVATHPIREWQKGLHVKMKGARTAYQAEMEAWEASRKAILSAKDLDQEERTAALQALGPRPTPPWGGVVLTTEPTMEGLARLLATGWPSVGLFVNEGGVFLGGYAMGKDHRLRAIATLSTLWDGQPLDRVRVGEGVTLLYGRRLAAHIMAQPQVASTLLNDPLAQEQGILARFLLAHPQSTAGTRLYVAEDPKATPAFRRYQETIAELLGRVEEAVMAMEDKDLGLEPRVLHLSPEAKALWVSFYNHLEAQLAEPEMRAVRAFASKVPEHALRLAGVLALMADPDTDQIGREAILWGIGLAEYYLAEAFRLTGAYRVPQELLLAERVLDWLRGHLAANNRHIFHLAEVYRLGPSEVRSAQAARDVIRILEAHGYLIPKPGAEVDGKRRREAWEVVPHAL